MAILDRAIRANGKWKLAAATERFVTHNSVPETLTWACPPSSAGALVSIGLADRVDLQGIHANPWVKDLGHTEQQVRTLAQPSQGHEIPHATSSLTFSLQ